MFNFHKKNKTKSVSDNPQNKPKKKSRNVGKLISDVALFAVVLMLLYPITVDIWNARNSSYMFAEYTTNAEQLAPQDYAEELRKAHEYNESLIDNSLRFHPSKEETEYYETLLNTQNNGIMAYLTAESIGAINVPIYHGVSKDALQVGAGHMPGSSLPVGGENTHCAISGHTGMSGLKMFSQLTSMKKGDIFKIDVLNETLYYEVDKIETVLPENMDSLKEINGGDYVTLITCTPMGVNSHRLLVRGKRIEGYTETQYHEATDIAKGSNVFIRIYKYLINRFASYELVMAMCAFAILVLFLIPDAISEVKNKKKRKQLHQES